MTSDKQPNEEPRKNIPKLDGSGRGVRANAGRGGCDELLEYGQGRRR